MKDITIVRIDNPENYTHVREYGILQQLMQETAVINFDSNMGGMCTNIKHSDYHVVPSYMWEVYDGEAIIPCCGGYIRTGLKIWR